jgi:CRISPR-associated protein Cmr2
MTDPNYIAISIAPVQGFIERSRKLRDLYGSSFTLSYLARAVCNYAEQNGYTVISPATINMIQGTTNVIVLRSEPKDFATEKSKIEQVVLDHWKALVKNCRIWIEVNALDITSKKYEYSWRSEWELWENHAWEIFIGTGDSNDLARKDLNQAKRSRSWTAINWMGESSTLSGSDAVAWFDMGKIPSKITDKKEKIEGFYRSLSLALGETFIRYTNSHLNAHLNLERAQEYGEAFLDPREELSIPELVKRLITHIAIAKQIKKYIVDKNLAIQPYDITELARELSPPIESELSPKSFKDIGRLNRRNDPQAEEFWTGWFQGDGDRMGNYIKNLYEGRSLEDGDTDLTEFSQALLNWGNNKFKKAVRGQGRTVYAGGDDFFSVFYDTQSNPPRQLSPYDCLEWLYNFPNVWTMHGKPITVSAGLVWAAPKIPQRDLLQHCRETEKSAKSNGRDRLAIRILFNGGNHLDWVCPWRFLKDVLESYCDRNGKQGRSENPNWGHIYNDVAVLEARHAFDNKHIGVSQGLFEIYFGRGSFETYFGDVAPENLQTNQHLWNQEEVNATGILGEKIAYRIDDPSSEQDISIDKTKVYKAINNWVINLAKIGFHLCSNT